MIVDLNCDLGEGAAYDAELMPLVTSANISCGAHAGDETTIRQALRLAKACGVAVGAHPSYADRGHFGRREMSLDATVLWESLTQQIETMMAWAALEGVAVRYLKPHGALYNQSCRDERVARPVIAAAEEWGLPILALPESKLEELCRGRVAFVREGFADRRYRPDGTLVPRTEADAMVTNVNEAVAQAMQLVTERGVRSLCVHGDNPDAVSFVRELRRAFAEHGLETRPFAGSV
jgi:UPF0271 protein